MRNGVNQLRTTITLNGSACALCDLQEPILLPETIEVTFASDVYKLSNLVLLVTAKNGNLKKQYKASDKNNYTIDLTELLHIGAIDLEISACVKSEPVKTWRVPSIFVKEINHQFALIPEIEELKAQLKLQAKAINELKLIIDNQGA